MIQLLFMSEQNTADAKQQSVVDPAVRNPPDDTFWQTFVFYFGL